MTRRALFRLFAAAPIAAVVDPEKLLWTPGKKLISIPRVVPVPWPVMPSPHYLCEWYTRHVLMSLEEKLKFAHLVNREFLDQLKIGDIIAIPIQRTFSTVPTLEMYPLPRVGSAIAIRRPPRYRAFTQS